MKKTLALCLALLPALGSAASPASEVSDAAAAFRSLAEFKPAFASKPLPRTRALSVVDVSGNIDFSGNVSVPRTGGYVNLNLHGWADVADATGQIRSGSTSVYYTAWIHIPSTGWINEWIYPSYRIELSKDGRSLGEAQVRSDGGIYISGHVSGGWVYISGRGRLSGTIAIQEP